MQPLNSHHLTQRIRNTIHSLLIIVIMFFVLGFTAELVMGASGWWLIIIIIASILISMRVSPFLIMRLYHAQPLSPQDSPELYRIVAQLCEKAELESLPKIFYIPSAAASAFTTGRSNNAAIAVSDGLLRQLNLRELSAVLAHEVSHIRHRDIWTMSLADSMSRLTTFICTFGFLLLLALTPVLLSSGAGFPLPGLILLATIPYLTALLQFGLSRTREFDADLGAVELTDDPAAMISALEKIDGRKSSWFSRIFTPQRQNPTPSLLRTHPPTEERIARLRRLRTPHQPINDNEIRYAPSYFKRITHKPRRRWSGVWY